MWLKKKKTIINTFLWHHIKTCKYTFWNQIHELNILYYIKPTCPFCILNRYFLYAILINTSKMSNMILKIQRKQLTILIVIIKTINRQTQRLYLLWCNNLVLDWKAAGVGEGEGRGWEKQFSQTGSLGSVYLPNVGAHMCYQKITSINIMSLLHLTRKDFKNWDACTRYGGAHL